MRFVALLLLLVGPSCDEPATPSTAPATSTPPPMSAAPPTTAPPASSTTTHEDPVEAARAAYRDAIDAFDARHADDYFAAFEPTLSCFYGQRDVPLDRVRRERWHDDAQNGLLLSVQLAVVAHDADQVVLLDRGFFREDRSSAARMRQVMHEKIIVMHRDGAAWRIAAETSAAQRECLGTIIPDGAIHDGVFDSCRTLHHDCLAGCGSCEGDACGDCASTCQAQALACLGVRDSGAHGVVAAIPIRNEDDVRHFVQAELDAANGEGEEDESAFLDGAERTLIAPYIGVTSWDQDQAPTCAATLIRPIDAWMDLTAPTVSAVRCARTGEGALDRCVVTLTGGEQALDATLLFDGDRLRAVHRDPVRDVSAPVASLDRWATEHPPEWAPTCPAGFVALVEDRVGDDYFEVGSADEEDGGEGIPRMSLHRLCGAAARAAVIALGDDWRCDDAGCDSALGCGNWCNSVSLDAQGRVLGAVSSFSGYAELDEAIAASAREHIACGGHGTLPAPDDD